MDDLISRQAAIKAIEDLQDCYNGFSDTYDKACIIGVIEEVPPIEPNSCEYWDSESHFCALRRPQAVPVRRGKWTTFKNANVKYGHDSCGFVTQEKTPYCPNCGARMGENDG